jgi:2-polyprenyl-3-methyl-5-hydroxy-6-metoxy-1,4-benzoquinol methylase
MSIIKKNISPEKLKDFFENTYWYHTFDVGDGVVTDGMYDLRPVIKHHNFPESLKGKSVLDVGTSDGFYAFEFEKRGASSVLAVDTNAYDGTLPFDPSPAKRDVYIEKYTRESKEFEKYYEIFSMLELKGANKLVVLADYWDSIVRFQQCSVYELERLDKKFDFVFCGALIEHLKNPLQAIEQLRAVTREKCVISLSSALPVSQDRENSFRQKIANLALKMLGLEKAMSVNERDLVLHYVGNVSGGSFFQIHPTTFREMLIASGFKDVQITSEYILPNHRYDLSINNVVFNCYV